MTQNQLTTPEELIHYQLKSALKMEHRSLESLGDLEKAAQDKKIKKMFSHHADETREQIANLEAVFKNLGINQTTAPNPATTGIKNQATALLERTDKALHNQVVLMSALGNEHFEISTYSGLILQAMALKESDSVKLLEENLDQEVHTSEELLAELREQLS